MKWFPCLIICFIGLGLFSSQHATATMTGVRSSIGAIVDSTSRVGKEARVAIEMAIDDNNSTTNPTLVLQIRNSRGKPWKAALAARDLIHKHGVKVILGPHTWGEVSSVAEIGGEAHHHHHHVPILSLADSAPPWATERLPFLVQASPSQYPQMKAVAAILKSRGWNRITLIYENIDSASSEITHHLSDAIQEVGAEITHTVALSPFASLSKVLGRFKRDQCKVFVVHTSLALGIRLFQNAKKMEMMTENGYAWIATNTITDLLHSVNASAISSMQGILGIKSYFPETNEPQFLDFSKRFRRKFSTDYPEEVNNEPGVFAVRAYDATMAVALALRETDMGTIDQQLFDKMSLSHFNGLSGKVQFLDRKLAPAPPIFQIVSVIGESNRVFWSHGKGFSETIDDKATYKPAMRNLGQVLLPGRQLSTLPTSENKLKVGVPARSLFKQFVNIINDTQANKTIYTGFAIEVFNATMVRLNLPYDFFPYNGRTYDDMVKQVYDGVFDAVAADVTILAKRYKHVDFTQPYSESGLEMIVLVQSKMPNKAWIFMKPFTKSMWGVIVSITVYNGFAVWLIERNHVPELRGSALDQIGTLIWLAFTTLFSLHGERLHSNLSRMAMVVWLFVALIITQSYTASLASMLTAQRLEPRVKDIETLKNNNWKVGYCRGSFVAGYLEQVLGFKSKNIIHYNTTDEYAVALRKGELGALFLEVPSAKLFLAQYCKSFVRAGETFKVGGFGFAFPKDYPKLALINEAILNISESGELKKLEDEFIVSEKCMDVESGYNENGSLSLNSFWVLFVLTGGTSTVALAIYAIIAMWKPKPGGSGIRRLSGRVSHAESPRNPPKTQNHPWTVELQSSASRTSMTIA